MRIGGEWGEKEKDKEREKPRYCFGAISLI